VASSQWTHKFKHPVRVREFWEAQAVSSRFPEATAALSHNVSQMSGDEAKIKTT
jgi:hypothetical protein